MDLGQHVRTARKSKGWTQQQLADKAGVGLNFVYQLEKNKPSVQLNFLNKVLIALDFQLHVLPKQRSQELSGASARPDPWLQAEAS